MEFRVRTSTAPFQPAHGGLDRPPTLSAEPWVDDAQDFRPGCSRGAARPDPDRPRMKSTPITEDDVIAALGPDWRDAKTVLRAIGKGHVDTVRRYLRDLRVRGVVECTQHRRRFVWRHKPTEAS